MEIIECRPDIKATGIKRDQGLHYGKLARYPRKNPKFFAVPVKFCSGATTWIYKKKYLS
jgi:hypothetical protein